MDPNEVTLEAPERDEIHDQFLDWAEEQLAIASAMAAERGGMAGPLHAEHSQPMYTATVLPVEPFCLCDNDTRCEACEAERTTPTPLARRMPVPSRPYTPAYRRLA